MVVQGSQLALHFLICVTLFADLQMSAHIHTFSTLFFFRDNFDGEVFLLKSAVKDGADL